MIDVRYRSRAENVSGKKQSGSRVLVMPQAVTKHGPYPVARCTGAYTFTSKPATSKGDNLVDANGKSSSSNGI